MTAPLPPLGGATPPALRAQRGVLAAIACIALFGVSQGMTHPLLALRLNQEGWSAAMIGLNGAMVAVSALVLAPFMPALIRVIGLSAFLALGVVLSSAMLLLFPVFEGYGAWLLLRFLQGTAATMLFVGSEAWIVSDAEEGARGRIVGLYATVLSLGFAAGPMILAGVGVDGATPFVVCAVLALTAFAPLVTAWADAPRLHEDEDEAAVSAWGFIRAAPTVMGAVILFGAVEFGVMAMLPVWGVRQGFDPQSASFLVSVLILGNVVFQIPLGALADKVNRRALLFLCAAVCLTAAILLPLLVDWRLWAMLFVWGGLAAGLYTVALVELGARYKGATLVSANAAVVTAYGIGALAGPVLVGGAMDIVDPHGLSIALGLMSAAFLGVVVQRARARRVQPA